MSQENKSVNNSLVASAVSLKDLLKSESGRQTLGEQLAVSIRSRLADSGLSRQLLSVYPNREPIDIESGESFATTISYNGQVVVVKDDPSVILPIPHERYAPAGYRVRDIQGVLSDTSVSIERSDQILDALLQEMVSDKVVEQLRYAEDCDFVKILSHTCAQSGNIYCLHRQSIADAGYTVVNIQKLVDTEHIFSKYKSNLKLYLLMNAHTMEVFKPALRLWAQTTQDHPWLISSAIPNYDVYGVIRSVAENGEDRTIGVMSVFTDAVLLLDEHPLEAKIGYVGYEDYTLSITRPSLIFKFKIA